MPECLRKWNVFNYFPHVISVHNASQWYFIHLHYSICNQKFSFAINSGKESLEKSKIVDKGRWNEYWYLFVIFELGEEILAVIKELLDAASEVVPKSEENLTEVTQSSNEQPVMDVQLVETARKLQPIHSNLNKTLLVIQYQLFKTNLHL